MLGISGVGHQRHSAYPDIWFGPKKADAGPPAGTPIGRPVPRPARKAGFHECVDSEEMFVTQLYGLQNERILPR